MFLGGKAWLDKTQVDPYTHGFTGKPDAALAERFHAAGMRLLVGLVKSDPGYNQESDLSSIADKFVKLY